MAQGCEVLLGDDTSILRINFTQGEAVAMGMVTLPPGTLLTDVVVVEVLASGALSAIQVRPVLQLVSVASTSPPTSKFKVMGKGWLR